MRAAIYCRVSTARQAAGDKVSMEDQEDRCRAVCAAKGWEVVAIFDEGDASAGTVQRGEFQKMLAAAKAGQFDLIVAREVSRLSRVAQARRAIEELMVEWGVAVCNARTGLVYSESEGLGASVIWTLEARLAEAELAEKSFRTTMGKNGKAAKGLVPSAKAPYGYRWHEGKLEVEPGKAEIVRHIFGRLAAGASTPAVASELNRMGEPSPGGSARGWQSSTVFDIATRRAYIGEHTYGLTHWQRLNSDRDRAEWAQRYLAENGVRPLQIPKKVKVPGLEVFNVVTPVIIDSALWERVHDLLPRTRKASRSVQRRPGLLTGLLVCAECGRPMQNYWTRGREGAVSYFYRCASHIRAPGRVECRKRRPGVHVNIAAKAIEAAVWGVIDGMLSDVEMLSAAIGAHRDAEAEMAPAVTERLDHHERRLAKAQLALTRVRRLFLEGDIDEATYREDRAEYERQVAMLSDELERMRGAQARREHERASQDTVLEIARRWEEVSREITDAERREVLVALLTNLTVNRDDDIMVTGTLSTLAGSNKSGDGGRYSETFEPRGELEFALPARVGG